jgi:hypothetical protein
MWTFKVSESALDDHVLQLIFISCNTTWFTIHGYIHRQIQQPFSQTLLASTDVFRPYMVIIDV